MGKKILVTLLCVLLVAAVICAFVFKNDLNAARTDNDAAKVAAQEAADKLTAAETELAAAQEALKASQDELAALQAAYDAEKAELEAKSAEINDQLAAKDAELQAAQEALAAKEAELQAAQEALAAKEAELTAAQEAFAAQKSELTAARYSLAAQEKDLTAAQDALAAKDAEPALSAVTNANEVVIFHTNDVHSRVKSDGMGYAAAAGYINAARAAGENVLVLDAGDTFHGLPFSTTVQGESITGILNAVGYTAMAPGNHDYNYGVARLIELSQMVNFPILCCNLVDEDDKTVLQPYTIKEVGGYKIGLIGVDNPEIYTSVAPVAMAGYHFADGVACVEAAVAEIKDSTDAIVVIAHWGTEGVDVTSEVLAKIEGVDLVVDGHSHSVFPNGYQVEDGATIVSTGEYLKNLGMVKLSFGEDGVSVNASLLPMPGIYQDAEVASTIAAISAEQDVVLNEVVGNASVALEGAREFVRTQETNLADVICDAMIAYTGADVAMTNGGGIRSSIDAGDITRGEVITVLPFGNTVMKIEVTGAILRAALENGLSIYPEAAGAFPQVGGIRYSFDPSKEVGSRVYEVLVNGEPLDDEKTYTLATNDFMATGGNDYTMFVGCEVLTQYGGLDEALMSYIASGAELPAEPDGRIAIGEAPAEEAEDEAA